MAVMLISVRERTPEIGVRRAVGGRRSDLMIQFLLESLILGLAGTLAGALVGLLVSVLLRALALGPALELPWLPTLGAVGVGLCFTLLFGLLPARRAAGLDPAQALRSA
jgi:putative ABC transport system permease protein